jgi:hypothetical protein
MAKSQREKIITGLAGEFLVAGHLSLKGYVASLTLKNYPEVDIFCLNPQNGKQCTIQVKTKRGGRLYYVPEKVDDSETPFVFVYINKDDSYDFFIISVEDVAFLSAKQRQYYIESFNGKMRDELLAREIFYTLKEAQVIIEIWSKHHNTIRPHSSLGYRPPVPATIIPQSSQFQLARVT